MEWQDQLRVDELRELLLFLDQYQLSDLVLMHGIRRQGYRLTVWLIVSLWPEGGVRGKSALTK